MATIEDEAVPPGVVVVLREEGYYAFKKIDGVMKELAFAKTFEQLLVKLK